MYRFALPAVSLLLIAAFVPSSLVLGEDSVAELVGKSRSASAQGEYQQAADLLTKAVALDDKNADLHRALGQAHFKNGDVDASIKDFDRVAELSPSLEKTLWERGISHYYAGKFDDGAKQFELYQTYHDADVENAAWRYLCVARSADIEKARASILPIEGDRRIPMMKIYAMYQGKATPDDVMATAKAGEPSEAELDQRLFYAHLYIGLIHEVAGEPDLARKHIAAAVKHPIGHYMHDVARVHLSRLENAESP